MKTNASIEMALVNLQRDIVGLQKQLQALSESVSQVITATTESNACEVPPQSAAEIATQVADRLISRLRTPQPSASHVGKHLREREVAEFMGIKVATLRAWRMSRSPNGPPFTRVGRMILYPVSELEKHMAARLVPRGN